MRPVRRFPFPHGLRLSRRPPSVEFVVAGQGQEPGEIVVQHQRVQERDGVVQAGGERGLGVTAQAAPAPGPGSPGTAPPSWSPVAQGDLVVTPLPELGAGDLGGGGVLHEVVDGRRAPAVQPRGQVLEGDAMFWRTPSRLTSPGVSGMDRSSVDEMPPPPGAGPSDGAGRPGPPRRPPGPPPPGRGGRSRCRRSRPDSPGPCPPAPSRTPPVDLLVRLGMNAAIPPMAWAPRRWQVFTSSSV
jgi:hypothetical protein